MGMIITGLPGVETARLAGVLGRMGYRSGGGEGAGVRERTDASRVDEWLLTQCEASAEDPFLFRTEEVEPGVLKEFCQRAGDIVEGLREMERGVLWEETFGLTLPLWRGVLGRPHCVVYYGRPEVASARIASERGLPESMALALWERYACSLINASRFLPTVYLGEEACDGMEGEMERLVYEGLTEAGVSGLEKPSPEPGDERGDEKAGGGRVSAIAPTAFQESLYGFMKERLYRPEHAEYFELSEFATRELSIHHREIERSRDWRRRKGFLEEQFEKDLERKGRVYLAQFERQQAQFKRRQAELKAKKRAISLSHDVEAEVAEIQMAPRLSLTRLNAGFRVFWKGSLKQTRIFVDHLRASEDGQSGEKNNASR
jgi:hypothetical protein